MLATVLVISLKGSTELASPSWLARIAVYEEATLANISWTTSEEMLISLTLRATNNDLSADFGILGVSEIYSWGTLTRFNRQSPVLNQNLALPLVFFNS